LFQSGDCIDELDDSVDAVISSPDRHQTLLALFMTRHLQQLNQTVRIKDHSSPYQKSLNNNSSVITISEKFKESLITAQQCRCSSRSRFTGSRRASLIHGLFSLDKGLYYLKKQLHPASA
jgi:hypothetical protein